MAMEEPEFIPAQSNPLRKGGLRTRVHPQTLTFLFALVVTLAFLQLFPLSSESLGQGDEHTGAIVLEVGFPKVWARFGTESNNLYLPGLKTDILIVGVIMVGSLLWSEMWLTRLKAMPSWYNLFPSSWVLLAIIVMGGLFVQRIPFELHYQYTNYKDEIQGVPFAYSQIRHVMDNTPRESFSPYILAFDFLLVGAVIAEMTYWFEIWQRGPSFRPIEEN